MRDDLEACNRLIVERMQSPVALIPQLAAHIVAAGGKRLRPLLTLAAARLCGHRGRRHVALAACVEFIHTATLLHDDVVDESALRRGQASANALFGNKPSVLVGDFLFARAFQLMVDDGSLRVLAILSEAAATIAEGEVLQLVTQNDTATDRGAVPAGGRGQDRGAVRRRDARRRGGGRPAGGGGGGAATPMAATSASPSSSWTTRSTIRRSRSGWARRSATTSARARSPCRCCSPSPAAPRRSAASGAARWRTASRPTGDLRRAQDLMRRHGALRDTVARARSYGDAALSALAVFPHGAERPALAGIVEFCIARAR